MKIRNSFLILSALFIGTVQSFAQTSFVGHSQRNYDVTIKVRSESGQAIAGARINIATPIRRASNRGLLRYASSKQVFFSGITNSEGLATGTARIPARFRKVSISIVKPGHAGRYSKRRLKKIWGPMAPAAFVQKKLKRKNPRISLKIRLRGK